jgi:DNA-binding transcriptional MerR regulator
MKTESLDLTELADRAGVSPRTVRYYIQQGLLPSPDSRGPGTRYEREHLDRLRLIRLLQHEHLPLAEIRRRLEGLDGQAVRDLIARGPEQPQSSAKAYIERVLSAGEARSPDGARPFAAISAPPLPDVEQSAVRSPERSQWDRVQLAPDVELHIRRPLSRVQNRQVDRLLEAARDIFQEDAP